MGYSIIGGVAVEAAGSAAEVGPSAPMAGVGFGIAIAIGLHKILK